MSTKDDDVVLKTRILRLNLNRPSMLSFLLRPLLRLDHHHQIARGFTQNYFDTFSPVVWYDSIRFLLAVAARNGWEFLQFDVQTALLYGTLEECMEGSKPVSTPMEADSTQETSGEVVSTSVPYREAVGCLIFFVRC